MTPLDIMEALRGLPADLVDIQYESIDWHCASDEAENCSANQTKTVLKKAKTQELAEKVNPSPKRFGSAFLSYLLTAGCTAACIAGTVLLLRFAAYNDEFSINSGTSAPTLTEIMPAENEATSSGSRPAETVTTALTVIAEQTAPVTGSSAETVSEIHFTQAPEKTTPTVGDTTAKTVTTTAVTTMQTQTTVTDASPYQKPDAAGLFEKYAFDFPVYQIDGGYAVSIDNENIHCYDLNGNEIDCRWSNCRIFDNPYRYSEFHAEEDICINPYDFIYTCNCENGIYYAVLDNGTAIIAGADRAWLDENKPETLVIPEEINGFRVTEIASRAFDSIGMKCESLHEIRIADTVEIIHPYAFENAFLNRAGAKINIPANVKTICRRAFSGNNDAVGEKYVGKEKADRVIILPDSLEYLQADAFTSETRYIFKMPESPVLSDSILIGSNRSVESADLSQYPDNYFEKYYVDGNFNVVTFRDAFQYFSVREIQ